jgi:hypothetical protein
MADKDCEYTGKGRGIYNRLKEIIEVEREKTNLYKIKKLKEF